MTWNGPTAQTEEVHRPNKAEVLTLGVDGFLVRFGTELSEPANRAALAFRARIDAAEMPGVVETSTSLTSTFLRFDLERADHTTLRQALHALLAETDWMAAPLPKGRRLWRVPAVFGTDLAPQLAEASALAEVDAAQAVAEICAAPLRVQTIGFAPGLPYLGQLPSHWNIPRQTALTPSVPEGALVVAIRQMVLFPVSTPTGWRHVGQTALRLFRPEAAEPFLLHPGDEVLFTPIPREGIEALRKDPAGGARAEPLP